MRKRVVIVGGGIAGLSAAYELSRTAEARARWDVEIVELGHRFGGRLASAHRRSAWGRNEEHGLHVWFGFYDNTFRLAEQVWRDWSPPAGCPWSTIWDALRPIHGSDHALSHGDDFEIHRLHHPRNSARPGAGHSIGSRLTGTLDGLRSYPQAILALFAGITTPMPRLPSLLSRAIWPAPETEGIVRIVDRALTPILRLLARFAPRSTPAVRVHGAALVERALIRLHEPLLAAVRWRATSPAARELTRALDLALAAARGLSSAEHEIAADGDLDRISAWELRAWLRRHGACEDTLAHSQFLDALYDIPFAYVGGDRTRPVLEAGTAMRFTLRILGDYKHAVAYLLRGGAGETLVAPLCELLIERGVRFRPFHRLVRVGLGAGKLAELELVRQARVRSTYDPLITREGMRGFKDEPDWSQLEDGAALQARGVDFYSRFGDRGEEARISLRHGVDFDDVILALPLGCILPDGDGHSPVLDWITAFPPAARCLEKLHLVPTVAAQLWLQESPQELGLAGKSVVTWAAPYSVACDMSPVIEHERWPAPPPRASAYLCGAAPMTSPSAPSADRAARRRDTETARTALLDQLERHGASLFSVEATLHAPANVADPLDAQYVRANVEPWDLADLALPGADAVRLEAAQTGLDNLALAGSWVRTPINTTSVEGAVCSGIAAARALGAATQPILAEDWRRTPSRHPFLPGRAPRGAAPW